MIWIKSPFPIAGKKYAAERKASGGQASSFPAGSNGIPGGEMKEARKKKQKS
jgi:hypothetical protein